MEIVLIAVFLGALLFLIFFLYDQRQLKQNSEKVQDDKVIEKKSIAESQNIEDEEIIDYNVYRLKFREYILYALLACTVLFLIGLLFYKNMWISIIIASLGTLYPKFHKKRLLERRKEKLNKQFQQALYSLSSSLIAGRSIERAFLEVVEDLRLLYPNSETYIIKEFELINKRIENQETVENALLDFSNRAGIEDITNFTDVFITCNRTGGDLVEVIRRTSNMIRDKFEIQQEISVLIAQKKFESNLLTVSPIIIIAILTLTAEDYMEPLYNWRALGPIVMTISLGIIIFSFWLSRKIMNIKV